MGGFCLVLVKGVAKNRTVTVQNELTKGIQNFEFLNGLVLAGDVAHLCVVAMAVLITGFPKKIPVAKYDIINCGTRTIPLGLSLVETHRNIPVGTEPIAL
jgi:hypothetical protein